MNNYLGVLKEYASFTGRSSRREFWTFQLFHILAALLLAAADTAILILTGIPPFLTIVYGLGTFLPSLAVSVRRLHDTNRSGWWNLIALLPFVGGILLLVFLCSSTVSENNRFGEDLESEPNADDIAAHQIYRGDDYLGEYTTREVQSELEAGSLVDTDYAWDDVSALCTPVGELC